MIPGQTKYGRPPPKRQGIQTIGVGCSTSCHSPPCGRIRYDRTSVLVSRRNWIEAIRSPSRVHFQPTRYPGRRHQSVLVALHPIHRHAAVSDTIGPVYWYLAAIGSRRSDRHRGSISSRRGYPGRRHPARLRRSMSREGLASTVSLVLDQFQRVDPKPPITVHPDLPKSLSNFGQDFMIHPSRN